MRVIKAKDIYAVDTFSSNNTWETFADKLEELEITEEATIDFTEVKVSEPWTCDSFNRLIQMDNIHMRFFNCEKEVKSIKLKCILAGRDPERIVNVVPNGVRIESTDEKRERNQSNTYREWFEIDRENKTATLILSKHITQIQNSQTISFIAKAIESINNDTGIENFIISINEIIASESVLQALASCKLEYGSNGILVDVDTDDPVVVRDFAMAMHKATTKLNTNKAKYIELCRLFNLPKYRSVTCNIPGILMKYKASRRIDDYGRQGNGEIVMSRIAILKRVLVGKDAQEVNTYNYSVHDHYASDEEEDIEEEIKEEIEEEISEDMSVVLVVESYDDTTFYTKLHWGVEHDGETLDEPSSNTYNIPLNSIGFCNSFIGTSFHFGFPIQNDESENRIVIYDLDENGCNLTKQCTIPERMKIVFNDWDIDVDNETLDSAIELTNRELSNKKNKA